MKKCGFFSSVNLNYCILFLTSCPGEHINHSCPSPFRLLRIACVVIISVTAEFVRFRLSRDASEHPASFHQPWCPRRGAALRAGCPGSCRAPLNDAEPPPRPAPPTPRSIRLHPQTGPAARPATCTPLPPVRPPRPLPLNPLFILYPARAFEGKLNKFQTIIELLLAILHPKNDLLSRTSGRHPSLSLTIIYRP